MFLGQKLISSKQFLYLLPKLLSIKRYCIDHGIHLIVVIILEDNPFEHLTQFLYYIELVLSVQELFNWEDEGHKHLCYLEILLYRHIQFLFYNPLSNRLHRYYYYHHILSHISFHLHTSRSIIQ